MTDNVVKFPGLWHSDLKADEMLRAIAAEGPGAGGIGGLILRLTKKEN